MGYAHGWLPRVQGLPRRRVATTRPVDEAQLSQSMCVLPDSSFLISWLIVIYHPQLS